MEKPEELKSFCCPAHPKEVIRKVYFQDTSCSKIKLACIECVMELSDRQRKTLLNVENYIERIAHSYRLARGYEKPIKQLPEGVEELLIKEKEMVSGLSSHFALEKSKVKESFDILKYHAVQCIDEKRDTLLRQLDEQLKEFEVNIAILKSKVESSKTKLELPTVEAVVKHINQLQNAVDFQRVLSTFAAEKAETVKLSTMETELAASAAQDNLTKLRDVIEESSKARPWTVFSHPGLFDDVQARWYASCSSLLSSLQTSNAKPVHSPSEGLFDESTKKPVEKTIEVLVVKPTADRVEKSVSEDEQREAVLADSKILTSKTEKEFIKNCLPAVNWRLLYRGSRDGFRASDFHKKCDNQNANLVIVECTTGQKFGGCCLINTVVKETQPGGGRFMFSITLQKRVHLQRSERNPDKDTSCCLDPSYGPQINGAPVSPLGEQECSGQYSLSILDLCNERSDNHILTSLHTQPATNHDELKIPGNLSPQGLFGRISSPPQGLFSNGHFERSETKSNKNQCKVSANFGGSIFAQSDLSYKKFAKFTVKEIEVYSLSLRNFLIDE